MTDPFPDRRPDRERQDDFRVRRAMRHNPDYSGGGPGFLGYFLMLLGISLILLGLFFGVWFGAEDHPFPMTIGAVLFVVFLIAGIALIGAGRKRPGEALPGRDTQSRSRVGGVVEGGFGFLFVFLGLILILFGMYLGSCSLQPGAVLLLGFAVVFVIAGVAVMRVGLRMCSFGGKREVDP